MDNKWNILGKGKERQAHSKEPAVPRNESPATGKKAEVSDADDSRASLRRLMETEFGNIIGDEIKSAAKELVEEQRLAIRDAVEEHKRAIRDVVEQEKLSIRAKKEELRESIIRRGMG